LGDSVASALGVKVKALRIVALALASASASAVVSFAGLLGFVGLVVPHIARRIIGNSTGKLLAISSLCGASLVIIADLFGRMVLAPTEIPVGIVMALIGAPFFLILLIKGGRESA
jgi:iron complex transport system permease protein